MLFAQQSNVTPFYNLQLRLKTQLPGYIKDSVSASLPCCYVLRLSDHFRKKNVRRKTLEIPRHFQVAPSIYEVASELVTKCLRNPRKRQFRKCISPFLRFPVFHIVFLLFLRAFPMFLLAFLPVSYFRSYGKLTRWLPMTSILVIIGRICRYQFKRNYLKNERHFVAFLLHF